MSRTIRINSKGEEVYNNPTVWVLTYLTTVDCTYVETDVFATKEAALEAFKAEREQLIEEEVEKNKLHIEDDTETFFSVVKWDRSGSTCIMLEEKQVI